MKRICFFISVIIFSCTTAVAQVTVSGGTAGINGIYTTLTAATGAFAAINAGGSQAGNNILITISADIVETGSGINLGSGDWTTITINPTGGASRLVSTNLSRDLIIFNGADNVTIDGLNTGGNALTFTNNSVSINSTFQFYGDATNNTITRCTILSSSTAFGTIYFGDGIVTGNDNNSITQCDISAAAGGLPVYAICSLGLSTAVDNSNNTIAMNTISNYYYDLDYSAGIILTVNNSAWTINNNKFYQTATRTYTSAFTHHAIRILGGDAYSIENNTIGFANAAGTGTTNLIGLSSGSLGGTFPSSFTAGGTPVQLRYTAINCAFKAGGVVSSIQNNIIGGIALYTSSAATATNGMLCGIAVTSGNANIGTVTGNTIGSGSGSNSIYVASTSAGGVIAGIYCTSTNTIAIQNNTIGGIDASGTTVAQATGFKGIDVAGSGNFTVSNNNVGNATANNIRTGYLLTGANLSNTATTPTSASGGGVIRGIVSSATGTIMDISNNIIRGMQVSGNASTYTGISTTGTVTASMNITANQIGNAGTNAVTFPFTTAGTVIGISVFANAPVITNVNNNSIDGITCPGANSITGITTQTGSASATLNVNNNSFINVTINGVASSTPITAISNSAIVSTLNITGNTIRSNSSTAVSGNFNGIVNSAAVVNTINLNNNQLGNASGAAIAFSAVTTGALNGISNINAAANASVNINNNALDGFSVVNTGQIIFIQNTAGNAGAVNMNNNQLGTVTGSLISFSGVQTSALSGIYNPSGNAGVMAVSIQGNDFRGIVQTATGTASQQYINCQAPVLSGNISNNTFTNLSIKSSGQVILILRGGAMNTNGTCVVSNNSIVGSFSKTVAGNNVIMYLSAPASVNGSTLTISGNNFSNITTTGATTFYGIQDAEGSSTASAPTKTFSNNTFNNISGGTGNKTIFSISLGNNVSCFGNTITNISATADIIGILSGSTSGGTGTHNYYNNTITNLTSPAGFANLTGILVGGSSTPTLNVNGNTVSGLIRTSSSSGTIMGIGINAGNAVFVYDNNINTLTAAVTIDPVINGIQVFSGVSLSIYRNVINNLEASGDGGSINGISLNNGTTVTVNNNFISELRTPDVDFSDAIHGISVTSVTPNSIFNLYYNSIYLNATSTAGTFGSSGIYHTANATATTTSLNLIDNIIVNTSTAKGSGVTAAFRRSGTTLANYASTSNNNLFYAGTPSASRLIYYDGTNSDQTLAAYKTRLSTRDANSISVMPNFISSTNLHLLPSGNCSIDGNGIPIATFGDDIDLQTRDIAAPDIGADEFTAAYTAILAGIASTAVCDNRTVTTIATSFSTSDCRLIATALPSGGSPLTGKVNTCVTLDATQLYFNGEPYVQRHHDMEPVISPATATATVTLYYTDAEFVAYNTNNPTWPTLPTNGVGNTIANRNNVRVTQFHGTPTGGLPTTTPGNYTGARVLITPGAANVVWNGSYWSVTFSVTGFSGFYLHTTLTNAPLPIVVNYLNGHKQGGNHVLDWKVTCVSTPRATMTLERSSDARNFTGMYTITADAARCAQPFDYADTNPLKGMNYYRLKIVDADGKITYSTTVALLNAVKGFDIISIAPNPVVSNNFNLNVASAQTGKMDIVIFDMQGRLVNRQTLSLIAGYNSLPVNVANLSSGTYTIKGIVADDQSKVIRFVKQ